MVERIFSLDSGFIKGWNSPLLYQQRWGGSHACLCFTIAVPCNKEAGSVAAFQLYSKMGNSHFKVGERKKSTKRPSKVWKYGSNSHYPITICEAHFAFQNGRSWHQHLVRCCENTFILQDTFVRACLKSILHVVPATLTLNKLKVFAYGK